MILLDDEVTVIPLKIMCQDQGFLLRLSVTIVAGVVVVIVFEQTI